MDIKHSIHNMVSGDFIKGVGEQGNMPALNSSMLKMVFLYFNITFVLQGLSLISRGGLSVCWSLVSFTKKINSEGFLHLLLL